MEILKSLALIFCALLLPAHGYTANWYQPSVETSWQIQLQGPPDTSSSADLFILDLFDTPVSVIEDLHARGRHVICYFSAGTAENWRADHHRFHPAEKGHGLANWPGERWLDIRSANVREIMAERIQLAARKGCDGVDPDNVDGYSNHSGFVLTQKDQLTFNRYLARVAHQHGLAISLKNNAELAGALVDDMDFAVNESCHQWHECEQLESFIKAGKPVFHIDYLYAHDHQARAPFCQRMNRLAFNTQTLPVALDNSYRLSCNP